MPLSKPTTPRRTSNNRRSAPVTPCDNDVNAAGLYDSNSVQGRIRQWQTQSAAEAAAPDALSVRSNPVSDVDSVGSRRKSRLVSEEQENLDAGTVARKRRPRRSRWVDPENREWVREIRSSSTPRKRVISDEHWRSKESPKESKTQPPIPKQLYEPRDTPSPSIPQTREEREERRRKRREARKARVAAEQEKNDDGIRVYATPATPPSSPKASVRNEAKLDRRNSYLGDRHDESFSGRASPQTYHEDSNLDDSLRLDDDDGRHRRRSKYAETLERSPTSIPGPFSTSPHAARSKKGSLFSKTKEMFSKSESVPVVSNRVPSIEAWLEEQPDPFVDVEPQQTDIPPPLKMKSRRRKVSVEPTIVEDPNGIWDKIETKGVSQLESGPDRRRQSRKSRPSAEADQGTAPTESPQESALSPALLSQEIEAEMPSSKLKRRGARASRNRPASVARELTPETITAKPENLTASPSEIVDANRYNRQPAPPPYRPCPPTGRHALSTIVSVETFQLRNEESDVKVIPEKETSGLKRKLTTHDDLLSVLSEPRAGKSLRSARSVRRIRDRAGIASQQEILADLVADEAKYSRELRTLVDGVIPVLLQSVLSKSDSTAAAGLFTSSTSASDDLNFTKPIIDMGIALERLKSTHNRIPTQDLDNLLSWAQTAQKVYNDYLAAWRLGFQDVVVNLAPIDESTNQMDQGMARDENGDVVDSNGKKADVAYLLKRPLVRIKNLSKTFSRVKEVLASSKAAQMADDYAELTTLARHRTQEEQGRLEDEVAANVDATKARDPRTMAAVSGTEVDKSRRVKARDLFNMTIYHTSGQRIDCKIEMILRDNQPGLALGGDVLISELDDTGKWLFFPPVETKWISARKGEHPGDLVVMIRGRAGYGKDWQELLSLKADDDEAAKEWMSMLGSNPLPPKLNRSPSFINRDTESGASILPDGLKEHATLSDIAQLIPEYDVPIGEPSLLGRSSPRKKDLGKQQPEKLLPRLNLGGGLRQDAANHTYQQPQSREIYQKPLPSGSTISSGKSTFSAESFRTTSSMTNTPRQEPSPALTRNSWQKAQRKPGPVGDGSTSPMSGTSPATSDVVKPASGQRKLSRTDEASREWMSSPGLKQTDKESDYKQTAEARPQPHRTASTPSQDLPAISKLRIGSETSDKSTMPLNESMHERWAAMSGSGPQTHSASKPHRSRHHSQVPFTEDIPTPPVHSQRPRDITPKIGMRRQEEPPPPPPHRILQPSNDSAHSIGSNVPVLKPQSKEPTRTDRQGKRRSSSPLKHEYAPSTASDSTSESDSDDSSDASSDTSEDFGSEDADAVTPLVAVTAGGLRRPSKPGQYGSVPTTGTRTLAPSDSASQGPYRGVPPASAIPGAQKTKNLALLCSWSDRGGWDPVHPDECSIVISPGLIEAFEMSAAHSGGKPGAGSDLSGDSRTSSLTQQPLVAFELTPLVPLRRGTALDISIRSPPTANSKIKTTNNVMFRSRNAAECEALYAMINWARIHNPTYIALEQARPKRQPTVTFNTGPAAHSRSTTGSWFGFGSQKRSSYRASSAPAQSAPSVGGVSEASVGSIARSFLNRFGANAGFNLNRSSVMRKGGRGGTTNSSLYSSSSGTGGSGSNTPAPSQLGLIPGKDGPNVPLTSADAANGGGMVNNMKIRIYIREDLSKWVNLGAARLSILPPPPIRSIPPTESGAATPPHPSAPPSDSPYHARPEPNGGGALQSGPRLASSSHTPHRIHGDGREKRIVVTANKDSDHVFIDRVLGESCFERIMQSGIAVKVWEENERIADRGGVMGGRAKTYMFQFPGAREAGWVFGIVGNYRYGPAI